MLEHLALVIARIYDASVDPTRWKAAVARIALFMGVARAAPVLEDAAANNIAALVASCDHPRSLERYFQTDLPINSASIAVAACAKAGDLLATKIITKCAGQQPRWNNERAARRVLRMTLA
jgi:hypothetical protein